MRKKSKTGITSVLPPFAIVPTELAHDEEIGLRLKGLYAVLHGFCGMKNPYKGSIVFASKRKIGKRSNATSQYVSVLLRELEKIGWATIVKTKPEHTDIIILHAMKKQYISKEMKRHFVKEVEERQEAYK